MFIHTLQVHLLGMLMGLLRVLESPPAELLSGLMVLLLMGLGSAPMGVGGDIVQLGSPLMILVVRFAIASGHL